MFWPFLDPPTHLISRCQHFLIPTWNMTSAFSHTYPPKYIFFFSDKSGQVWKKMLLKKVPHKKSSEKKIQKSKKKILCTQRKAFFLYLAHVSIGHPTHPPYQQTSAFVYTHPGYDDRLFENPPICFSSELVNKKLLQEEWFFDSFEMPKNSVIFSRQHFSQPHPPPTFLLR